MTNKIGAAPRLVGAALLALAIGLTGCATPGGMAGGGGPSATQQGAISGAVIGGLLGYARGHNAQDTLVGAAAGAAIGALIGNYIDHKRVASAQQVYRKYGTHERVVLDDVTLSRQVFRAGQKGQAAVHYDVVAPNSSEPRAVHHTIEYLRNGKVLARNTETLKVTPGGYRTVFPIGVPKGADEGEYTLVARVAMDNSSATKTRTFKVIYARDDRGALYVAQVTPR